MSSRKKCATFGLAEEAFISAFFAEKERAMHDPRLDELRAERDEYGFVVPHNLIPSLIELTARQFNRLLYDQFNIRFRVPPEVIELEFWKASVRYTPEPGIRETLHTIKARGVKMAVVSNFPVSGPVLSWELEKHGLLEALEFVLASADCGIRKPHPLIFSTALAKLGLAPSEAWFVGDNLQADIGGAKQAGLWAIWYNRQQKDAEKILPHTEVTSWSAFTALVQEYLN